MFLLHGFGISRGPFSCTTTMPRQSRGRSSSSSRAAPAQTRSATTAAAPPAGYAPARAPAPPANAPPAAAAGADKQPGMLAQMAATAGSVAIGSTIGHGLSSMLFGGGGQAAEAPPAQQQQQQQAAGVSCEIPAKNFTMCLEKADMQSCSYYLEQLKACQAAAAPY
ncbi:hypothetical protein MSAN_01555700 [Mycena sanguinolenta]|uniref:CHCH domain-containing protein n=1 Tax=Mycena sanguinolenta TaxID=230812 RepID=A0A8H6Y229_9AGAR|nr:hypothetical protein MSAN_01555700 [Mycena sanguinolenta]